MSRKKAGKAIAALAPPAPPPIMDARPVDAVPVAAGPVFAFPTRARCPRCGSANTMSYSTKDDSQYRRCLAPVCSRRFVVKGATI